MANILKSAYDRFLSEEGHERSRRIAEQTAQEAERRIAAERNRSAGAQAGRVITNVSRMHGYQVGSIVYQDEYERFAAGYSEQRREPDTKIDTDLMALVNACESPTALVEANKVNEAIARAERLKALGFDAAAMPVLVRAERAKLFQRVNELKLVEIKDEKILEFVIRLAKDYDLRNGLKHERMYDSKRLLARTAHYSAGIGIGRFEWNEVPVGEYQGIPPDNVLQRFEDIKKENVFQEFTVATIKEVPDPLLLGRLGGSRFFIAQWGDDIKLDDVI